MTIMSRVREHYTESLEHFSENNIVGVFLQGSQNYKLDTPSSDVDTKLIVTPSFNDIALMKQPVSTTYVRENAEHVDFKDIRCYMETFRKQNLNFLEILFTPYFILNPDYEAEWNRLVANREKIARMNPFRAVKSMKGVALEKYHAMEHLYPSKVDIIGKYGYDPKQTSHLVRVRDYLERYIAGEAYAECLIPSPQWYDLIVELKIGAYPLEEARKIADEHIAYIEKIANEFCACEEEREDKEMRELLEDVSCNILKISIKKEILC